MDKYKIIKCSKCETEMEVLTTEPDEGVICFDCFNNLFKDIAHNTKTKRGNFDG